MRLSFKSELYSHIVLIPLISGYFLYERRKSVLSEVRTSIPLGAAIAVSGSILYIIGLSQGLKLDPNDKMSITIFSAVTFWIGGFVVFYGVRSFRVALFPLLFLFFLTPIPNGLIERFILVLQTASTEVTYLVFRITGVPILREGFTFHLSSLSIEVAKQCSGIRSSIALVITSIIAGQLFLNKGWNRVILILSIFPVTVFKNGLRIVTLTLLGNYVDARILDSQAHRSGGIPFFVVGLLLLTPVLWALIRSEKRSRPKGPRLKA